MIYPEFFSCSKNLFSYVRNPFEIRISSPLIKQRITCLFHFTNIMKSIILRVSCSFKRRITCYSDVISYCVYIHGKFPSLCETKTKKHYKNIIRSLYLSFQLKYSKNIIHYTQHAVTNVMAAILVKTATVMAIVAFVLDYSFTRSALHLIKMFATPIIHNIC